MTNIGILVYIIAVFIASIGNVLLKISANQKYSRLLKEYTNRYFIIGTILFWLALIISLYAFSIIPLSMGVILDSTIYIFVPILSKIILKENLSFRNFVGMVIIVIGIGIFQIG